GHEDYIMWLELVKKQPAYCIKNKLAAYRISNKSLSSNKMKVVIWQWKIYRKVLGMNIIKSLYYFLNYIYFAIKKRN
ncbi:glycosyltransferase family 2 protein, partial [Escherichia coli]|nr:glycosyltransferase family 2 protein [Escherichia coli]